ncbi:hypothetical protein CPC08DRAFT_731589, partial [Agrocybe pediades]
NLDGPRGPRSFHLTEELRNTLDAQTLWDDYGIDDDIVPFTNYFSRADIHEILTPDLLHQLIKGTFKDHLVDWVGEYLRLKHGKTRALDIMFNIDRRIAASLLFPNLRRFPQGRRFKQWTGDDSKALMKVYVAAIHGHVPDEMSSLKMFDQTLAKFYRHREVFRDTGVCITGFSLPRQHALSHYHHLIQEFGALNGLCSSITESRHITAVQKPWRRSNRYNALGQMLVTNQRLEKLHMARMDFVSRGMLPPTTVKPHLQSLTFLPDPDDDSNDSGDACPDDSPSAERRIEMVQGNVVLARTASRGYADEITALAAQIGQPLLLEMTQRFLLAQWRLKDPSLPHADDIDIDEYPVIDGKR